MAVSVTGTPLESVRTATTDPYTFNFTPGANTRGIILLAAQTGSATDHILSVTFDGVTLNRVTTAQDTAGEPGRTYIYFVAQEFAASSLQFSIDLDTTTADDMQFGAISLTTATGYPMVVTSAIQEGDAANPSVTLSVKGFDSMAFGALFSGQNAPSSITPNANMTVLFTEDLGTQSSSMDRQTTSSTSNFTYSYTVAIEDVAMVAASFAETPQMLAQAQAKIGITPAVFAQSMARIGPTTYERILKGISGLQSFWTLGEPSGSTAISDYVGAITGTVNGTPTFSQPSVNPQQLEPGIQLNSNSNYLTFGDNYDFAGTSVFTYIGWVQTATPNSTRTIIDKESALNAGYYVGLNSGSPSLRRDSTINAISTAIAADTWGLFYASFNGTEGRTGLDYRTSTFANSPASITNNSNNLTMGVLAFDHTSTLNGIVGSIAVFNTVVSLDDIQALYTVAKSGAIVRPGQAQAFIVKSKGLGQAAALIAGTYFLPFLDTFTRTVVDGLGVSDNGDTWVLQSGTATNFDVNGSQGLFLTTPSITQTWNLPQTLVQSDINGGLEFSGIFSIDKIPVGATQGISFGYKNSASLIGTRIRLTASSLLSLNVVMPDGSSLIANTISSYIVGDSYNFKVQLLPTSGNTNLKITKFWKVGNTEPGWTILGTTTFIDLNPQFIRIAVSPDGSDTNAPFTWTYDNLQIIQAWITQSAQAQAKIVYKQSLSGQAQAQITGIKFSSAQAMARIGPTAYERILRGISGLGSFWTLGEPSGYSTVSDYVGVLNGTTSGTITFSQASVNPLQLEPGALIGTDSKILFGDNYDFDTNPKTIILWIKHTGAWTGAQETIIGKQTAGTTGLRIYGSSSSVGYLRNGSGLSIGTPQADIWQFIAITQVNSSTYRSALDDYFQSGNNGNVIADNAAELTAGNNYFDNNSDFKGSIASIAVFTSAFSLDDFQALYTVAKSGAIARPGQAQAKIILTYQNFAQSQAQITASGVTTSTTYAQAQAKIATTRVFAQSQSDILQTYRGYSQSQADIKQVYNTFAQAQGDIKQTYNVFAQSQADIKVTSNVFAQSQADIKQTYSAFAQAQSDIKQTYTVFAQAQSDIKSITNRFAQSQADIKATSNAFAQAQGKIIPTRVFSQAQADIKQTYRGFAQSQADINATSRGYSQAQADIKKTTNAFAQSQADIKATTNVFSQAQADIKATTNVFAQSQADIKATTNRFAQAQGDIKSVSNAYSQAHADIKVTTTVFAQAQADILVTYRSYAQAQASIKQVYNQFAQANADIKATSSGFAQAQAKINAFGVNAFAQALGNIKGIDIEGVGQAQAKINAFNVNGFANAQADIKQTYPLIIGGIVAQDTFTDTNGVLLENHTPEIGGPWSVAFRTNTTLWMNINHNTAQVAGDGQPGFGGQVAYKIASISNGYLEGQAVTGDYAGNLDTRLILRHQTGTQTYYTVKILSDGSLVLQSIVNGAEATIASLGASSDRWIRFNAFGSSPTTLQVERRATQGELGTSWQIDTTDNTAANQVSTGNVLIWMYLDEFDGSAWGLDNLSVITRQVINPTFAQAQANIIATSNRFAQAQADIKQTYNVFAQANADILVSYRGYAQAQAEITLGIQTYTVYAQAQSNILTTYVVFAQAQARIQQTYLSYAQSQADIKQVYNAYSQAQADIITTYRGYAQAQADIKATSNGYAQSQADTLANYRGYGQAQARILTTYMGYAQAQACIRATVFAQAQAEIKQTYQGYANAQAGIKQTYTAFAQAQGTTLRTYNQFAQSQADIKQTYRGYAQAQADIVATYRGFAQAQTDIKATYQVYAQAQADISATYQGYAQAQAKIVQTYYSFAQAQATILAITNQFAQAQADILQTYQGYAQANAGIKTSYLVYSQAQADILRTFSGFAQAQGTILAVSNQFAQAQGSILAVFNAYAQAQAQMLAFGVTKFAQAQGNVQGQTYPTGQAQAQILAFGVNSFAQAQADIRATSNGYGQAQSSIKATYNTFAQAQADIIVTYNGFAQAQAYIKRTEQGYSQAQARIYIPNHLHIIEDITTNNIVGVVI